MLNRENGTASSGGLIPDTLANAATTVVEALKINSVTEKLRRGRPVVVKRRNIHSEQMADLANLYFRMVDIPIRFWSKVEDWRRWETDCFQMLNGDRFRVFPSGANAVCVEKLPGEGLWDHMNRGTLTRRMLVAAARELRRAHHFWSDEFRGRWSHGDATTTNVIYDHKSDRARLIDFEIIHEKSLPTTARHADDLLVFLLDMVGIVPSRQWLPFALCFLNTYADANVLTELRRQLALPGGLAWIWWGVRTNFANPAKVKRRLAGLSSAIAKLELHCAAPSERARQMRRPSITCQAISPGTPRPSSRTRAIKERAKALAAGMPSKLPMRT